MKICIINSFSPETSEYKNLVDNPDNEIVMFTKKIYAKYFSKQNFLKIYSYENFYNDGNLYKDIIECHEVIKFDRIIATHEFDIERAAMLRDYLNIKGQSYKSALQFRDKYFMKNKLQSVVVLPSFQALNHPIELIDFTKKNNFPIVIKPRMGAASVDIIIISNKQELEDFLKLPLETHLMMETFVAGEMYHVDGFYKNKRLLLVQPSKYINNCLSFDDNIALGSYQLSQENPLYEKLNEEVKKVLDSLDTPDYAIPFHAEFFYDSKRLTFCEIACRVGGGLINEATNYTHEIDLALETIEAQFDFKREINKTVASGFAGWVMIPPKKGVLSYLEIAKDSWIIKSSTKPEYIGMSFDGGTSSASQIVSYAVFGNSEEEVIERINLLIDWQEQHSVWLSLEEGK